MGRNNYFQFKQFRIIQEKTAMKVGIDGILLGAWTNVSTENNILDVGTGTGLIALMTAQKCNANITGIEIEKEAAKEASENVAKSPWENRIIIENTSFQKFSETTHEKFDLIISNPPFFTNGLKPTNNNLAIAKHNDLLPLQELLSGSLRLLNTKGKLAVILPVIQSETFIDMAETHDLFLIRLTEIKSTPLKESIRYLMEFSRIKNVPEKNCISIYNKAGNQFSRTFKGLTKDFYLNF